MEAGTWLKVTRNQTAEMVSELRLYLSVIHNPVKVLIRATLGRGYKITGGGLHCLINMLSNFRTN